MGKVMRKILVCGSAGFLMSNMMRYMLYRTKDYEFASIDPLRNKEDQRNIYMHKRHSFHVGDVGNPELLDRVVRIENPDIVVIGTGTPQPIYSNGAAVEDIVLPTASVCDLSKIYGFRVVRLVPDVDITDMGSRSLWNHVETMVFDVRGTVLRMPVCFGRRGRGLFEQALCTILSGHACSGWKLDTRKRWYAYAEDVASMLWFIMENPTVRIPGPPPIPNIVRMPALGCANTADMIAMAHPVLGWGQPFTYNIYMGKEEPILPGWMPDSKDLIDAVLKTAKWYTMNKWIFDTEGYISPLSGGR